MPSIIVLGSLNMDQTMVMPKLPVPGETVLAKECRYIPGGKGGNQAVAAARMGGSVHMVGRVGADIHGKHLVSSLQDESIGTTYVTADPQFATGTAVVGVDTSGQNSIMVLQGANSHLGAAEIAGVKQLLPTAASLIAQLEIPPPVVQEAFELARAAGVLTILNAAPAPHINAAELLLNVDVLIVNETEAEILSGLPTSSATEVRAAALWLSHEFRVTTVLTCGGEGAVVCHDEIVYIIPPCDVQAINTVGAGDAFVGALAVGLGEGLRVQEAAHLAAAAGALAVTKVGAQESLPRREAVEEFIRRCEG